MPLKKILNEAAGENAIILIFCRHVGGYGGEENCMVCMLDALHDFNVKVFVQKTLLNYGMLPRKRDNLSIEKYSPKALIRFLKLNSKKISIFIKSSPDPFEKEKKIFKTLARYSFPKGIIPAGNDISRVAEYFDYIFWEADNATDFGSENDPKNVILHPPAYHSINTAQLLPEISSQPYYLTVFNSYNSNLKGDDILYSSLDHMKYPLIWCSSDNNPPEIEHPKLFKVSASRNLLAMLIASCYTYISFSHSEGFGWSVFQAMAYRKPIISRPVGIAKGFMNQILLYDSLEDLIALLKNTAPLPPVDYDLNKYKSDYYRNALFKVIAAHSTN